MSALLEQLTQIQSSFSQLQQSDRLPEGGDSSNQALLESIKEKLAETELLVLGSNAAGTCERTVKTALISARNATEVAGGVSPEPDSERANARSNLMRYSTPNLILSSNFEHILRQQDRVSVLY